MKHLMKKAVKAAVFAALTTLALTAFASAEGEMAIGAGCTTGTSLRMRSEPNTSSAIVTTLNKSVAVALLDDSVSGWYKINYNGSTGYVSSDYLILDQDNIFTTYGRVPEGTVNVRAAATTESESLATIDAGTVVTVNGLVNGWYDVTCQYGTEGYIRSDLLVLTSNATSGMGVDKSVSNGVYDVLINGTETAKAIVSTPYGDVLPSSKALAGAGVEMIEMENRQFLLKAALRQVVEQYDFIFIDCPPSLELLTLNALCAANSLLVPVQGEYYALEGLSDLMNTVRIVRRSMNPSLDIEGVLLTMFDGRTNLSIQVAQEVKRFFGVKVYSTVIPRNVRLSEAPSHGRPITAYDRNCRGADAYIALAEEFLKRNA